MNVAGPVAQRAMVTVGLAIASAVSLTQVVMSSSSSSRKDDGKESDESSSSSISHPPVSLGLMAATAYHVEYFLSFTFVKLVAPISYSACDAVRRLGIIISGHFMFGGPPFTVLNILGIALSLGGALAYSVLNNR
jgi:multidrug transporter EmrE-like cation transporter